LSSKLVVTPFSEKQIGHLIKFILYDQKFRKNLNIFIIIMKQLLVLILWPSSATGGDTKEDIGLKNI